MHQSAYAEMLERRLQMAAENADSNLPVNQELSPKLREYWARFYRVTFAVSKGRQRTEIFACSTLRAARKRVARYAAKHGWQVSAEPVQIDQQGAPSSEEVDNRQRDAELRRRDREEWRAAYRKYVVPALMSAVKPEIREALGLPRVIRPALRIITGGRVD